MEARLSFEHRSPPLPLSNDGSSSQAFPSSPTLPSPPASVCESSAGSSTEASDATEPSSPPPPSWSPISVRARREPSLELGDFFLEPATQTSQFPRQENLGVLPDQAASADRLRPLSSSQTNSKSPGSSRLQSIASLFAILFRLNQWQHGDRLAATALAEGARSPCAEQWNQSCRRRGAICCKHNQRQEEEADPNSRLEDSQWDNHIQGHVSGTGRHVNSPDAVSDDGALVGLVWNEDGSTKRKATEGEETFIVDQTERARTWKLWIDSREALGKENRYTIGHLPVPKLPGIHERRGARRERGRSDRH